MDKVSFKKTRQRQSEGWRQGQYHPRNPEKYKGDINNIVYRSSWEYEAFRFLDNNKNVLEWASEPIAIPYVKPTEMLKVRKGIKKKPKVSRYYPDLWVKFKNSKGQVTEQIIEIKPSNQTRKSRARSEKKRNQQNLVLETNKAKWHYAQKWCSERNIDFRVLTEHSLGHLTKI